ncbi:MAG: homogentisate 1,2-dioxygenase, partial [Bacteroidota bacterium]
MPIYHNLGKMPHKRHTTFRKADGSHHYEQLFGTEGFSGMSSLLYHLHRPTQIRHIGEPVSVAPEVAVEKNITPYRLKGFDVPAADDFLDSRTPLLVNNDVHLCLAAPRYSTSDYFYKNADADELLFVHKGTGTLKTL